MPWLDYIRGLVSRISVHYARKRAVAELRYMSDHELRDLGIERALIKDFVYGKVKRREADPALVRLAFAANARCEPSAVPVPTKAA